MPKVQAGRSVQRYIWLAFLTALFPLLTPLHGQANPTVARLLASLKNNVVSITATRSDGSEQQGFGFIVGAVRGLLWIVTANHVVRCEGPEGLSTRVTLRYFSDQGATYQAKLLGTSSNEWDLAVLTAEVPVGFTWRQDAIGSGEQVEWGTDVWFIGRNGRWDAPAIAGKVTEVSLSDQIVVDNLPVQPGTSGAPLVSQNGIVGMIVSDAPGDVSRALTIDFIHKALRRWNHPWDLKPLVAKLPVATPGDSPH
jgi:S1-C subfamily serine protease